LRWPVWNLPGSTSGQRRRGRLSSFRAGPSFIAYWLCSRLVGHRWRQVEPGLSRCRICRAYEFEYGPGTVERAKRLL
jgi:hypothetical protein